ncbi:hypothetical protein lerEdw1_000160 [Lerista edwardsae]|nr:hypothetical protein lerEdw1_000160 [Lerista edwardsae]
MGGLVQIPEAFGDQEECKGDAILYPENVLFSRFKKQCRYWSRKKHLRQGLKSHHSERETREKRACLQLEPVSHLPSGNRPRTGFRFGLVLDVGLKPAAALCPTILWTTSAHSYCHLYLLTLPVKTGLQEADEWNPFGPHNQEMALVLRHSLSSDDCWCAALVEHRRKLSLLIEVLAETFEMLSNAIDTYIQ